jgi:hypothetical protein
VAASKEQGLKNNKGSISKYPVAHTEKQQIRPLFYLLALVGIKFLFFCFCFFDIFSQPDAQE